jgi:hypothetical protein
MKTTKMNVRLFLVAILAGGLSAAPDSRIAGTWQGKMDEVPAVTLTVRDEGGKLSGTGSGPKAEGKESIPLVNPSLDEKIFSFQLKNPKEELTSFKLELTAENEGNLKGG